MCAASMERDESRTSYVLDSGAGFDTLTEGHHQSRPDLDSTAGRAELCFLPLAGLIEDCPCRASVLTHPRKRLGAIRAVRPR